MHSLALLAVLCGCGGTKASAPADPRPTAVKIVTETPTTIEDASEYVATVRSRNSATIQPEVEGRITKIFVKSGDRVKAGAALLEIDPLKQSATVHSQEATRNARMANLEWTRVQLERTRKLYSEGVASKQELDQAQTAYDASKSEVTSLDAQLREQQVELHYYTVTAPSAGIIGDVPVHVGDRVLHTTVLTTVDDQHRGLEAYINVPAERAPQLQLGAPVQVLDPDGKPITKSRITFISPQVDTGTQSVLVKAAIGQPSADLRNLQFVHARVVFSARPGLVVPVVAVSRVSGQYFAFVAEQSDKGLAARQRPVRVGPITDSNYVVLDGLKAGDQVIVSGSQNLADGSLVSIEKQP